MSAFPFSVNSGFCVPKYSVVIPNSFSCEESAVPGQFVKSYGFPSVTISEKSAIVENSRNNVCSSASLLARNC